MSDPMITRAENIKLAVEHAAGCSARRVHTCVVTETFQGKPIWSGLIDSFELDRTPPMKAYGWDVKEGKKTQYVAVLGNPPIDDEISAVRAWLISLPRNDPLWNISNWGTTESPIFRFPWQPPPTL